jgi:hypoxanthine phosphoribosyltransferase
MSIEYKYISWNGVEEYCYDIIRQMQKNNYTPQAIIGLLRGGIVPARIFSDFFNVVFDFYALDVKFYNGINSTNEKPLIRNIYGDIKVDNCLIIDDIYDSGKTMKAILEHLNGKNVVTATLFWKETAKEKPDYYSQVAKKNEWISFPWECYETKREIAKL